MDSTLDASELAAWLRKRRDHCLDAVIYREVATPASGDLAIAAADRYEAAARQLETNAGNDSHVGNLEGGWTVERGVTCVVCPDCAFTFDAVHWNSGDDNRYSCPLCNPESVK